jgi:WD40 repeat protein/serine/threonine protein kinase
MRVRLEKDGAAVQLDGPPMARGGEAAIYTLPDRAAILGKVYHKPTPEHADKLAVMISNPPADPTARQGHASIAWPAQRLLDDGEPGRCVGFVMPRVEKARPLFDAFNPKSRLQAWPLFHYGYLLRTARNLAAAVRALHARGYVLGDLNESNVLVNGQALVTVVDTDSFQVRDGGRVFRCVVGKPEYAASEVQGADFAVVDRTPKQDAFALAVLIFQLLMQGAHPFAGRFTGEGEPEPLARRIAAGHWPYAKKRRGPYEPNPTAPPFVVVPPQVRDLMRRCFEDGHDNPAARPDAAEWHKALTEADEQLSECLVNPQHRVHKSLDACPWCELAARHGRDPFPSKEKVQSGPDKSSSLPAAAAVTAKPATPAPAVRPAVKVKSSPSIRTAGAAPRGRTAPSVPPLLLTPWPYLIGVGAVALIVLVGLIVTHASRPAPTRPTGPGNTVRKPDGQRTGEGQGPGGLGEGPGPAQGESGEKSREGGAGQGGDHIGLLPPDDGPAADRITELQHLEGHTDHITSVALSRKCDVALSGAWDGTVRLWDVQTGKERQRIDTGSRVVYGVALSPDDRFALFGGSDKVVHLWDLDAEREVRTFLGHIDVVRCVAFSADGKYVLAGGDDGTVLTWDAGTGERLQTMTGHEGWVVGAAFAPKGRRVASAGDDRTARVWDAATGAELAKFSNHTATVLGVAFAPKGNILLSWGADGTLRTWDSGGGEVNIFRGHDGPVRCAAFTPDGRGVLSGGDDGTLRLWDAATGAEVSRTQTPASQVTAVAFGARRRLAVTGGDDKTVRLWSLPEPKPPGPVTFRPPPVPPDRPPRPVVPRETPRGQIHCFDGHKEVVNCVALSPDGGRLVCGCADGQVYLWDVKSGEPTVCNGGHAGPVKCVAFSPDGKQAASGGTDRVAMVWDADNGDLLRSFEGHNGEILSLAFNTATKSLLTGASAGDPDPNAPIFSDVPSPSLAMFRYWKLQGGNPDETADFRKFRGPPDGASCIAFTPDRQHAVLYCTDLASGAASLFLWDLTTGKKIRSLQADDLGTVVNLVVSPDGNQAVSTETEGPVRLWSLATGKEMRRFEGHAGAAWSVAFSPKGDQLLTGGDDGTVRLWDVMTAEELQKFTGHVGAVRGVAFSPRDARRAASCGDDQTARLWDLSGK